MRSITASLVYAVACLFPAAIFPSEKGTDVKVPDKTIILHGSKPSGRPNAPSRIYIECTYGSGFINFSFPENIHELSVEIYNEEESISGFVTNSFHRMELPVLSGIYNIVCTTEDNKVFIGLLSF